MFVGSIILATGIYGLLSTTHNQRLLKSNDYIGYDDAYTTTGLKRKAPDQLDYLREPTNFYIGIGYDYLSFCSSKSIDTQFCDHRLRSSIITQSRICTNLMEEKTLFNFYGRLIGKGVYNYVFSVSSFISQLLPNISNSNIVVRLTQNLPKNTDQMDDELCGLLIQNYLYNKCPQHVPRVYDFGKCWVNTIMTGLPPRTEKVFAIMEHVKGNHLKFYITNNPLIWVENGKASLKYLLIFKQLFKIISCIHDHYIAHLDIKADNIMFRTSEFNIDDLLLIDFGFAKDIAKINEEFSEKNSFSARINLGTNPEKMSRILEMCLAGRSVSFVNKKKSR